MAERTMGDLTPTEQMKNAAPEFSEIFAAERVGKISKRLGERGKKTPQSDFYAVSDGIHTQLLAHTKRDISGTVSKITSNGTEVIGGGYDVGISGNAQTDKLIYALCQVLDRQERILDTPSSGIMTLFGDEATKAAIAETFADFVPIVINRTEFAKIYFGKKRIGGKEVVQVSQMLLEISTQKYIKVTDDGHISVAQPMFIPNLPISESDGNAPFVILLNTDFKKNGKYIPFPNWYLSRTQKASHLQHKLYAFLAKFASNGNFAHKDTPCKYTITEINLWQIIASEPKYNYRPKKRQEDFIKAVQQCVELGLIISYNQGVTKAGEPTAIFVLNKNYHLEQIGTK